LVYKKQIAFSSGAIKMENILTKMRSGIFKSSIEAAKSPLGGHRNLLILAGLIVVAVIGFFAWQWLHRTSANQASQPTLQTAVARRGSLVVSASATGQVIAPQEINLGFDESGTLSELLVKVGDKVKSGDVLARMQTGKTEQDIALALAEAQLNVVTAQQNLDSFYANADSDAANALKAVEDAQAALDDLQNSATTPAEALQTLTQAQQDLATAQQAYNNKRSTASQAVINEAYAKLVLAKKNYDDQKEKFNDYAKKPDSDPEKAAAQLKFSAAEQAYKSALSVYNAATGTGSQLDQEVTAADLAAAQAKVDDAQRTYDRVKNGPTPGELALTQANLAAAQAKYATLKDGPDPAAVDLAKAQLADAQAKLDVAKQDSAVKEITAPIDGTILAINNNIGDSVGTEAVISIADLSQPVLQIYLDETDMDKIGVGYEVDVTFDALPDSTFTGHVTEVSPSLQNVSNVAAVVAKVQIDPSSFSKPQSLPVGANASVSVIGGRAENAVLVPVEALREISPGQYAVFVMQNGELRLRTVTVGLMDYTNAQITSGLQAGEIVSLGTGQSSGTSSSTSGSQG
jgi:HlyD family secretion protein